MNDMVFLLALAFQIGINHLTNWSRPICKLVSERDCDVDY